MCKNLTLALLAGLLLAAGCASPYTLGFPGELPVQKYYAEFEPGIEVTIMYPDTNPRQQNLPVVIFNAGWNQPRASYDGYATQLAQWGYVAIIRTYPSLGLLGLGNAMSDEQVAQNSRLIDWCERENEREDSPLYGMIDSSRVATTGHSLGAGVAIAAALSDQRIKAAAPLDILYEGREFTLRDALAESGVAMLYLGGDSGGYCTRPPGSDTLLFDLTGAPCEEVMIRGADHMDFQDTPLGLNYAATLFCPDGYADPQEVRDLVSRYMIAWFNYYLKGQEEFETWFDGPNAQEDVAAGKADIRTNRG